MAAMEFSYTISEAEYLSACKIPVKRPGRNWLRINSYANEVILLLAIWGAFALGMLLESSDLVRVTAAQIPHGHAAAAILPASIVPTLGYFCVVVLAVRILRPTGWLALKIRREHFRSDPGCQAETHASITTEGVAFRSAVGSSQSTWGPYYAWAERGGTLILLTRAGVRKIIGVGNLSDSDKAQLRSILAAALPQK
jgi:hypothetical protein